MMNAEETTLGRKTEKEESKVGGVRKKKESREK